MLRLFSSLLLCFCAQFTVSAKPLDLEPGGKLLLTRGISGFEGTGGGALTPWALITGNETDRGIGATAHYTYIRTDDYEVHTAGGAVGFF